MPVLLDSITWSSSQPDLSVTYSFLEAGTTISNDGESLTAVEPSDFFQAQALGLFETIANYTNLTFSAATGPADLRIMLSADMADGDDGFMNPPGETDAGLGVFHDVDDSRFETGAYNYMVMTHELMHGLGLSHPHDDGGSSSIMDGVTEAFDDYGDFDLNQGVYTVMSYNNGFPSGDAAPDSGLYGYEMGPMALDIAVLQASYGANMSFETGDNAYDLDGENGVGTGWVSIWDAGGTDIINYRGALDVTIDLRAATLGYGVGGGGFVSSAAGVAGGFTIANGVVIENARGGNGEDALRGNSADNELRGSRGDDVVKGGSGDDRLFGGKENDKLQGGSGDDTLKGGTGEDSLKGGKGDDVVKGGTGNDMLVGGSGADTLNGGRGADFIRGGAGADIINGGTGADILKGGSGADVFVFTNVGQTDLIKDFETGVDQINLEALDADISIQQANGIYIIQLDLDSDGQFDDGLIHSTLEVTHADFLM